MKVSEKIYKKKGEGNSVESSCISTKEMGDTCSKRKSDKGLFTLFDNC